MIKWLLRFFRNKGNYIDSNIDYFNNKQNTNAMLEEVYKNSENDKLDFTADFDDALIDSDDMIIFLKLGVKTASSQIFLDKCSFRVALEKVSSILKEKHSESIGKKDDSGKLEMSLFPIEALEESVRVMMFGKNKYGRDNWKFVAEAKRRYLDAALRHLAFYQKDPQSVDEESGLLHIYHALTNLAFLSYFESLENKLKKEAGKKSAV